MLSLPKAAEPLVSPFSIAFTRPTFQRFICLCVGFIITRGRWTITQTLRTLHALATGHFSDFHRVLSRAPWSLWPLGKALAAMVLELLPADGPVTCTVDDSTTQHRGKNVYAKARHRDNVRSTSTHKVWLWGHRWVVLAINVKFSFATRPWALPVLVALYKSRDLNSAEGRQHRTPIAIARILMTRLLRWFPQRKFILLGDGGYASHDLARFCHRHRRQLTLVSLLHPRAHLCQPPPPPARGKRGRRRVRGDKLPHPQDVVARAQQRKKTVKQKVDWYSGKRRRVEYVTGTGHWYKATEGLVPIRWVFVHDRDGKSQDRYFYSTDPGLTAERIIALYTARWPIEVTFQECKQRLGLGSPRNRSAASVTRTVPCLLGLFSVVSVMYHRQLKGRPPRPRSEPWYTKAEPSFSDALASVRRVLWEQTIFSQVTGHEALNQLKPKIRNMLLDELSIAA